ncbi:hypothetical protein Y017_04160 [Alcanivorax sp. 97CO-5]|jgi:hypothetical protein|uniref:hypothetical protein n=1 Tax=unclassified Alcanivorax TaxID=2638842 RepID=UPI0003E801A9|nr:MULTISPECIES: hypothetical protein [unclassified Alcanivorax]EUC68868.1 hypothetical protein Y017_04160 [Alcanivorax sp. 97CO-5]PKG00923.1 hypothetical protein Y019_12145 [Alcanivorax sp. 97CO-6]
MNKIAIVVLITLISGCSANRIWYGSDVARLSYVKVNGVVDDQGNIKDIELKKAVGPEDENTVDEKHIGALIAWSPEFNAAFISRGGKGCIQPATYSKNNSGSAELPAEIISSGVASGSIKGDFSQALEKLITVSDQSTFLSIGVYGLCQLHANGGLTQTQLAELTQELFEKASTANGSDKSKNIENTESGAEVETAEGNDPS